MSIDEEVERCRQDLCRYPLWSLDRLGLIADLSGALFSRYRQLGGMEYLEESITSSRQGIDAIDLCPIWKPHRPAFLSNLGIAVYTRFEQSGRMEDLEETISCHREALALRPHGHPDRSGSLTSLGTAVS